MILRAFDDAGFVYHSRITIWKNPVTEMQRTKALGLLHKQVKKDSTMSRVGIPDYVLVFRKDGDREDPVHCEINVDTWQKYASPVWMDIDYGDTLNRNEAREEKDEKHICPLQLEVIRRCVLLFSDPGEIVFSPFSGIGSEGYVSIGGKSPKTGRSIEDPRRFYGCELKPEYYKQACKNLRGVNVESSKELMLF